MNGIRRCWPLMAGLGLLGLFWGAHYLGWFGWGYGMGWGGNAGPGWGHGGWSMGFMGLPMILFWVLVAMALWGVVSGSSRCHTNPPQDQSPDQAKEILGRRYAKGELTREEYLAMRRDLEDRG